MGGRLFFFFSAVALACSSSSEEPVATATGSGASSGSGGIAAASGSVPSEGGVGPAGGIGGEAAAGGRAAGGSAGGGVQIGRCATACQEAIDCCMEHPFCPGAWPYNPTCDGGACTPAQCYSDADCDVFVPPAGLSCLPWEYAGKLYGVCGKQCTGDDECAPNVCNMPAADGSKFCGVPQYGCSNDADCGLGSGDVCVTSAGYCACTSSVECTAHGPGAVCVFE